MTTMKAQYNSVTPCTITLASLGGTDAQASEAVDNTADLFDDILIQLKLTFASDPGNSNLYIGAYGSLDNVHWWGEEYGLDGTDKTIASWGSGNAYYNFTNEGSNYVYSGGLGGVGTVLTMMTTLSQLFQGWYYSFNQQVIPPWWGIIVFNNTSVAISATAPDSFINYRGYSSQAV